MAAERSSPTNERTNSPKPFVFSLALLIKPLSLSAKLNNIVSSSSMSTFVTGIFLRNLFIAILKWARLDLFYP